MSNEIVPGEAAGFWKLGMQKSEVIEHLQSQSSEYSEVAPGGFDFINTSALSFSFSDTGTMRQICVLDGAAGLSFRGVAIGNQVGALGELGYTVSVDINDRLLVLKDVPGIFFNFEGDDSHLEGLEEVFFEGDEEQLVDMIRPGFVLQSPIDRICISADPEINPMFDLNA